LGEGDAAAPKVPECRLVADDGSICLCEEVGQTPTPIYLVLDRSGSMAEIVPGTRRSRWGLVRSALLDREVGVLRRFGGRIEVGAAWFPSPSESDVCNAGREVFGLARGGPAIFDALEAKLATAIPRGQTPTAAALRLALRALEGTRRPAFVLLATDGAPNCGAGPCTADRCTYNLDGAYVDPAVTCAAPGPGSSPTNCCDPASVLRGIGWKACLDDAETVKAAEALVAAGIPVFVLGVPGMPAVYGEHLDALAIAGGVPQSGEGTQYYAAHDATLAGLVAAIESIAARAIDRCDVVLEAPVADRGRTNVLVDGEPVPEGVGFRWTSSDRLELVGTTCDRVRAGKVAHVQVVVGCPTILR
jgi:hypothetical protein